jgi:hypothetical protein
MERPSRPVWILIALAMVLPLALPAAADDPVLVNADNFVRAETAAQFDRMLAMSGGINRFLHLREPTPLDKQTVIRMNRDTIYSTAIVDISQGATLTVPDPGDRYLSVMVVNEDHYINRVIHEPGEHELTMEEFDTPYVNISVRILVHASDPADVRAANALQDGLVLEAASSRPYTHPDYDETSYRATYEPLLALSRGMPDARRTFGKKEAVDPVRHLLGTAFGWGGLPEQEAFYLNVEPDLPVGAYRLDVRDVPVDAFWSVSMYNKDGYFEPNDENAYSVNNLTATPNEDGSFTIHLGGDPGSANHLPLTEGWNYVVRLYQPRPEVLDGSWTFPSVEAMEGK